MKLNEKIIDAFFEEETHQAEVLYRIYRQVFTDWDDIDKIDGHPSIGEHGWKYICRKFTDFDKKHHPTVFAGGLWLNTGFSCNKALKDWEVDKKTCSVIYKPAYQGA